MALTKFVQLNLAALKEREVCRGICSSQTLIQFQKIHANSAHFCTFTCKLAILASVCISPETPKTNMKLLSTLDRLWKPLSLITHDHPPVLRVQHLAEVNSFNGSFLKLWTLVCAVFSKRVSLWQNPGQTTFKSNFATFPSKQQT